MLYETNNSKKIGIIDADLLDHGTRHPNLALMKISGYQKHLGKQVELIEDLSTLTPQLYEHVYVSKVFGFSTMNEEILSWPNVSYGGTGFFEDGGPDLPYEIEHFPPDYTLYDQFVTKQLNKDGTKRTRSYFADYLDYSIGFATRGCFRKCSFCVNKKYKNVQFHSHVNEWLDETRRYIYLWDDNILAYSKWEEVFDELNATKKPFQFRQGMDIRLMTPRKAEVITKSHYQGDYIFAFDHLDERKIIEEKLGLWRQFTDKETKLYILCGYEAQDENDIANAFERVRILMKYGCLPYIMRYEEYKKSPYKGIYIQLARWCNQPGLFKKMSFTQFCETNQKYVKTDRICAPLRALQEFKSQFPDIAKEYFDLRFDEQEYVKDLRNRRALKAQAKANKRQHRG